jgi:uncharacterized protein
MKAALFPVAGLFVILALALFLLGTDAPRSARMTLLTVADDPQGTGGTADITLVVRSGSGQIFIDSFPLTRLDTQSSTRYANQVACDFLQADCDRYDFFYTIRANSAIVGGPSAGAAIAVLTAAVLDGAPLREDAVLTGTINSGGIIGPVGGIDHKIEGARRAGLSVVLIPALTIVNLSNASNATAPTRNASASQAASKDTGNVTVIRVATLEEALLHFTGRSYERPLSPIAVPAEYERRMELIAQQICNRTEGLRARVARKGLEYDDTNNYTSRIEGLPLERAYSRASLCFSSNIELHTILVQNASVPERRRLLATTLREASEIDAHAQQEPIRTIADLETYAIVRERTIEARDLLSDMNRTDPDPGVLAYASERATSAALWSAFFGMPGQQVRLDEGYLRRACLAKIAEADERINYVGLYDGSLVAGAQETLREAQRLAENESALCLFTASKAKAQADLVAGALFLDENSLDTLITQKLIANERVMQLEQERGRFPMLGYSYARYAQDLAQDQPYSALTFAEYSLELSNLDMYFPKTRTFRLAGGSHDGAALFVFGAIFGAAVALLLVRKRTLSR